MQNVMFAVVLLGLLESYNTNGELKLMTLSEVGDVFRGEQHLSRQPLLSSSFQD